MSNPINDGGPAFPSHPVPDTTDGRIYQRDGMSLRDYFAGQALVGMCADPERNGDYPGYVTDAWAFADHMIAARNKEPS